MTDQDDAIHSQENSREENEGKPIWWHLSKFVSFAALGFLGGVVTNYAWWIPTAWATLLCFFAVFALHFHFPDWGRVYGRSHALLLVASLWGVVLSADLATLLWQYPKENVAIGWTIWGGVAALQAYLAVCSVRRLLDWLAFRRALVCFERGEPTHYGREGSYIDITREVIGYDGLDPQKAEDPEPRPPLQSNLVDARNDGDGSLGS